MMETMSMSQFMAYYCGLLEFGAYTIVFTKIDTLYYQAAIWEVHDYTMVKLFKSVKVY